MAFDDKQLLAFREQAKKLESTAAIHFIAKAQEYKKDKEKIDIISVICVILNELASDKQYQKIPEFLQLKGYFDRTKTKLTAGVFRQTVMLGELTRDSILNELVELVESVSKLEIKQAHPLWGELAIWFNGLYQFTAKDVPLPEQASFKKSPDKFTFVTQTTEDKVVHAKTNVTGYQIVSYYQKAADLIEQKLKALEPKLDPVLSEPVPATSTATTLDVVVPVPVITTTTTTEVSPPSPPQSAPVIVLPVMATPMLPEEKTEEKAHHHQLMHGVTLMSEGHKNKILIELPDDEQARSDFLEKAYQAINAHYKSASEKQPIATVTDYLLENPRTEPIEKLRVLREAIGLFVLRDDERKMFEIHMNDMISNIDQYANGKRYGVWFWSMEHAKLAQDTAKEIRKAPSVEAQLQHFFDLFDGAKGLNSNTLQPHAITSCAFAYDKLVESAGVRAKMGAVQGQPRVMQ